MAFIMANLSKDMVSRIIHGYQSMWLQEILKSTKINNLTNSEN